MPTQNGSSGLMQKPYNAGMETMQSKIEQKIRRQIAPEYLDVVNESSMHNVPPGSESHFKLTIVARSFAGCALVERHRRINSLLAEELAGGVHALSLNTLTPEEWAAKGGRVKNSPPCLGGSSGQ